MGTALCLAVVVATKAAPTTPEIVAATALVAAQLEQRVLRCTRHLPGAVITLALSLVVGRPLLSSWLDQRELNANFFFAATLLIGVGQLLLVYDVSAAALHADAHDAATASVSRLQRAWRSRMFSARR